MPSNRDDSIERNDDRPSRSDRGRSERYDDADIDDRPSSQKKSKETNKSKALDEGSRLARWSSLLKTKLSFGFHHLSPAHLPSMSEERRAYALCFEKVTNWHLPETILKAFGEGDYEITLQLSLSFYHLNSASFFGSTWMGPAISLGSSDRKLPAAVDFDYADIVYFLSRITDPSCVAVIEIVVSKFDNQRNMVTKQFGCGWTMINVFSKPFPIDIADDRDRKTVTSCSIFSGSPRDLVLYPDSKALTAHLKEVPNSALFLKIYSHRQLLKAQRLLADNEAVGRYDHVAGLTASLVVPPGETRGRPVPCIGSDEFLDAGKALHTLPSTVKMVTSMEMTITSCQIFIPTRESLELRMIDSIYSQYKKANRAEIRVLQRTLKVGLHNGHGIVGGQWSSYDLIEDTEDGDMLLTSQVSLRLPYYVPDVYMALIFLVEYQLGVQASRNNHLDSHTILEDQTVRHRVISVTTLGLATYIPCDGKKLLLSNTGRASEEGGVNVEIRLVRDELSNLLNPTHLQLKTALGQYDPTSMENTGGALADAKLRDRSSYIGEDKLRSSGINQLRTSTATENLNLKADLPANLGAMIGFDLKLTHPSLGVLDDESYVDDILGMEESKAPRRVIEEEETPPAQAKRDRVRRLAGEEDEKGDSKGTAPSRTAFKPRSSGSAYRVTGERFEGRTPHEDGNVSDHESVSESIVTGDSERSHVRLSSLYYSSERIKESERVKAEEENEEEEEERDRNRRSVPRRDHLDAAPSSNLMAFSMQAKLGGEDESTGRDRIRQVDRDFLQPQELYADRMIATKTTVPLQRNEFFIRPITRGAKTRLNRHGIADVIQDSADAYLLQQQEAAVQEAQDRHGYQSSLMKRPTAMIKNYYLSPSIQRVDIWKEAEDELNVNEVNVQFVGYRGLSAMEGSTPPRAIYCSFQYYACQPTRTEALRLQPADPGSVQVLARDDPNTRNEPPLVLRYIIDHSKHSSYEAYEYADYLAHHSLYVDVWDADSLLYIGTVGIPCKLFMRQGSSMVKHALEADIINGETVTAGGGGLVNMVILDNGPLVGERVGSLNLMISCQGIKGGSKKYASPFRRRDQQDPVAGLNWRVHGNSTGASGIPHTSSVRPKNRVRARPLTEAAPELSNALTSIRDQVKGVSFRSLSSYRGGNGLNTLNYDEVIILFKRFPGEEKGSVQYRGDLLALMDLPSMSIMLKKLVKAYKVFGEQAALRKEALRHANHAEELSSPDVVEFLRVLFDKTGIKSREEDRLLVANHLANSSSRSSPTSKTRDTDNKDVPIVQSMVSVSKLLSFFQEEADKIDWMLVSNRIKLAVQRALLQGKDVQIMLTDYDTDNSKFISIKNFKAFLNDLSIFSNLSYSDVNLAVRVFARHGRGLEDRAPVSIEEVLAFLGIDYVGNLQGKVKHYLQSTPENEGVNAKYVLRLLSSGKESSSSSSTASRKFYNYDEVISVFRSLGLFNVITPDQALSIMKKLDNKGQQHLSAEQILTYLGLPYKAADLTTQAPISIDVEFKQDEAVGDTEELLKILLRKVQSNGVAVDEAFRHFDTNGDGFISPKEFEQGLEALAIFDHIPQWKQQLSNLIIKFDSSHDGLVSLKEFFKFLGVSDYAPNIIQRLTKIFAVATMNGLSFKDIFQALDSNHDNSVDANELVKGLESLGTFGSLTKEDALSVIKRFDNNHDEKISLEEFISFFQDRVQQDLQARRVKKGIQVAKRFREVMMKAQGKGANLEDIFRHLDGDRGGSISIQELSQALQKLPNLKALSGQEINDLLQAIDIDNSGDVTLEEFERFVNGAASPSSSDGVGGGEKVTVYQRIRETFATALARGLSFEDLFQVMDGDGNRELSIDELERLLRKLPSLHALRREEVEQVFSQIDLDHNRYITVDELKAFVRGGEEEVRRRKERDESKSGDKVDNNLQKKTVHSKEEAIDLFIRHLRRISEIDGSIRGLFAYLDDDEDGLIRKNQFYQLLRREEVFDSLSREEVDDILQPFVRDHDYLVVVPLLKFVDGEWKNSIKGARGPDVNNSVQCLADFDQLIIEKDYSFSRDPEVRAVEKKLRALGRLLAKQGQNVEEAFERCDPLKKGWISRTDFVQVLSQLGFYLLEEGRVLQDENAAAAGGNIDLKRAQIQQINRLKGYPAGQGHLSVVPKLARKMFQSEGAVAGGGEFKSHLESLTVIDWYRQGQKQQLLQRVLSHSLAHTIHLYPRFGKSLFFEYPLTNPFNHEERFEIEINDPELRLVVGFDEWQHLRRRCRPCVGELGSDPVEAEVFDRDANGKAQATLLPFESFALPFTFMTLIPYHPAPVTSRSRVAKKKSNETKEESKRYDEEKENEGGDDAEEENGQRMIEVKVISGSHGHLVAVLRIYLHLRPSFVHRVLRFQEVENTIAKRQVRLVGCANQENYVGDFHQQFKYVHCVETPTSTGTTLSPQESSRVVVEWGPEIQQESEEAQGLTLLIRYKCAPAPQTGSFYLLIYDDPYQSILHEIWEVIVTSRLRIDVQTMVQSPSAADLVIRGDQYPRRARAFSSYSSAYSISFKPENVFQLVPGAYNRVMATVQAKTLGHRRALINVVDVDSRELLNSWLVQISASAPAVSRSYDVVVTNQQPIYKKILFKNPWDIRRKFVLLSSDEEIMRPRVPVVEVAPRSAAYLRLWFSPWTGPPEVVKEVHLFLNDAVEGQNEECHLFRVRYALP